MLELLQQGFGAVFSLNILILMFLGVAVGIVFGAVPGLSATMAVALCLPLTFTMGPQAGLSLLVALFIGATSGGLISAIVLIALSPVVSGSETSMLKTEAIDFAIFPLSNPGIISIPLAFFLGWIVSVLDKRREDPLKQSEMEVRSLTGLGAEKAVSH